MLPLLERRLALLSGGPRDRPDRQQSVRAAIAWSHDLLTAPEQRLFAHLSLFVGGFTLSAAEAVCDADLDELSSLIDKSVVRRDQDRYFMLETIREYALERFDGSGDLSARTALRQRHAEYFAAVAEAAHSGVNDDVSALGALDPDVDNHRAALSWEIGTKSAALAIRHLRALENYFGRSEQRIWFDRILELPALAAGTLDRVWALRWRGALAVLRADFDVARPALNEALSLAREFGSTEYEQDAVGYLGQIAHYSGDLARAEEFFGEALALARQRGLPLATELHNLGTTRRDRGDFAGATQLLEESLGLTRYVPTLLMLGELEELRGNRDRAGALIVEAFERARSTATTWAALAPLVLAWWYVVGEDTDPAARLLGSGLRLADEMDIKAGVCMGIEIAAAIAASRGELAWAAELQGAADGFAKAHNLARWVPHAGMQDRTRALTLAGGATDANAASYHRGLTLSARAALQRALAVTEA
jgi:tetratricopeptide (TPR) repeat protein